MKIFNKLFGNQKKGSRIRFCSDARPVNKILSDDWYVSLTFREIQTESKSFTYCTKLNLDKVYYQLLLHPNDMRMLSFIFGKSVYSYRSLSFGLCNSPAFFQRQVDSLLFNTCREAYQDNILILSSGNHHVDKVKVILKKLWKSDLSINPKK